MKRLPELDDCRLISLSKNRDRAGNLTSIHQGKDLPFEIARVFYIYDVPGGEDRGAHAHKSCHQFIVAASGAFDVETNDGKHSRTVSLNRPYLGLYVPPGIWAQEKGFSSGSVCLVFASQPFEETDYIRDFQEYRNYVDDHR